MIKVRLECRNGKIEKIAKCLAKFPFEYKIWEYNNILYAVFKVRSLSDLKELGRKLKLVCEFRFSRIDFTLPWWKRWLMR